MEVWMSDSVPQVAKIKLKVGTMELEYEGASEFLTGGIEALLETMGGLVSKLPAETPASPAHSAHMPPIIGNGSDAGESASNRRFTFSTNTIAAHLDAKSGPELVICAMAELELVQRKASSSRTEILTEMKNATTYFNVSMRKNLSASLNRLLKDKRINEIANDTYALSAKEKNRLEEKVADIG